MSAHQMSLGDAENAAAANDADGGAGAAEEQPSRQTVNVRTITDAVLAEQYEIWGLRLTQAERAEDTHALSDAFVNWKCCYFEIQRRQDVKDAIAGDDRAYRRTDRRMHAQDREMGIYAERKRPAPKPAPKGQGKLL